MNPVVRRVLYIAGVTMVIIAVMPIGYRLFRPSSDIRPDSLVAITQAIQELKNEFRGWTPKIEGKIAEHDRAIQALDARVKKLEQCAQCPEPSRPTTPKKVERVIERVVERIPSPPATYCCVPAPQPQIRCCAPSPPATYCCVPAPQYYRRYQYSYPPVGPAWHFRGGYHFPGGMHFVPPGPSGNIW